MTRGRCQLVLGHGGQREAAVVQGRVGRAGGAWASRAGGAGGEGGLGSLGGIQAPVSVSSVFLLTQLKQPPGGSGLSRHCGTGCRLQARAAECGRAGGQLGTASRETPAHRRWPQCAGHPERSQQACGGVPCGHGPGSARQLRGPIPGPGGPPSARPGLAPSRVWVESGFTRRIPSSWPVTASPVFTDRRGGLLVGEWAEHAAARRRGLQGPGDPGRSECPRCRGCLGCQTAALAWALARRGRATAWHSLRHALLPGLSLGPKGSRRLWKGQPTVTVRGPRWPPLPAGSHTQKAGPGYVVSPTRVSTSPGPAVRPAASVRPRVWRRTAWVFESRRQRGRGAARAAQQARLPRRSARAASPCCRRVAGPAGAHPAVDAAPRSHPRSSGSAQPRSPAPTFPGLPGPTPSPWPRPAPGSPASSLPALGPRPVPQQPLPSPSATAFPEPRRRAPRRTSASPPRTAEHPR